MVVVNKILNIKYKILNNSLSPCLPAAPTKSSGVLSISYYQIESYNPGGGGT